MEKVLLIAVGGGAGAVLRHLVSALALKTLGPGGPYGTLAVNVVGGLAMGLLVGALALRGGAEQERLRLLLGVGLLGGFTTFSAFSLELSLMMRRSDWAPAMIYAAGSVVLSVAALFAGLALARRLMA
jgi:fluoride exporter